MAFLPLTHIPSISADAICTIYDPMPLWDSQCVTSLIPDIEKVLSEAATIEEKYYQLLCGNIYQISKKELEESRKIKMS